MSMTTEETLTLQALKFKAAHVGRGSLLEAVLADAPQEATRNICALISVPLFNEVEQFCNMLELSKREFVEMALVDLLEKTHAVIDRVKPWPEGEE